MKIDGILIIVFNKLVLGIEYKRKKYIALFLLGVDLDCPKIKRI